MPYVENSVHFSVTYYQQLSRLSDFNEIIRMRSLRNLSRKREFRANRLRYPTLLKS